MEEAVIIETTPQIRTKESHHFGKKVRLVV